MVRTAACGIVFMVLAALATAWSAPPRTLRSGPSSRLLRAAPPVHDGPSIIERMYRVIDYQGLDDPKATLDDELCRLERSHGLKYHVNDRAFKWEGVNNVQTNQDIIGPNRILPGRAPLGEVLQRVLDRVPNPSGATWMIRRNHVEITTWASVRAEIWHKGDLQPLKREVLDPDKRLAYLRPLVHIEFRKKPLSDAVEAVARRTGWNIVLDSAIDKTKADWPITMTLTNAPLDSTMLLIASMVGLEIVELDNILFLTTADKALKLAKKAEQRKTLSPATPEKK